MKTRKGGLGSTELDRIIWENTIVEYRDVRRKRLFITLTVIGVVIVIAEQTGLVDYLISLI